MTRLTPKQRDVLARMDDSEWYLGADIAAGPVLAAMASAELIRSDMSGEPFYASLWTITPDGMAALEASQ